jgi:hypothetical protein
MSCTAKLFRVHFADHWESVRVIRATIVKASTNNVLHKFHDGLNLACTYSASVSAVYRESPEDYSSRVVPTSLRWPAATWCLSVSGWVFVYPSWDMICKWMGSVCHASTNLGMKIRDQKPNHDHPRRKQKLNRWSEMISGKKNSQSGRHRAISLIQSIFEFAHGSHLKIHHSPSIQFHIRNQGYFAHTKTSLLSEDAHLWPVQGQLFNPSTILLRTLCSHGLYASTSRWLAGQPRLSATTNINIHQSNLTVMIGENDI